MIKQQELVLRCLNSTQHQHGLLSRNQFRSSQNVKLKIYQCNRINLSCSAKGGGTAQASSSKQSIFPAGKSQATVKLPAMIIQTTIEQYSSDDGVMQLEKCLQAGVTGVILDFGEAQSNECYDKGISLKQMIRGRARLYVIDRADIAPVIEADGILLTSTGLATMVARRLMPDSAALVGRVASDASEARQAAKDGANLVVLTPASNASTASSALRDARAALVGGAIPVLPTLPGDGEGAGYTLEELVGEYTSACAEPVLGACLPLEYVSQYIDTQAGEKPSESIDETLEAATLPLFDLLTQTGAKPPQDDASGTTSSASSIDESGLSLRNITRGAKAAQVLAKERKVLKEIVDYMQYLMPSFSETLLLEQTVEALDEPLLVLVVGEFNSGKSSIINALLGDKYLDDGVLPTTNEISVLKYGTKTKKTPTQDGESEHLIPVDLLKNIHIVDTPGTNVILKRQQRMTEEYVPRADIVLFVMSADRPFTESEVQFLQYIKKWGKKIVFVLNKVDMLTGEGDAESVVQFVTENAERLLSTSSPPVLAVSARSALAARQGEESLWEGSGFGELEQYMVEFFQGMNEATGEGGISESERLKLQTPLSVAQAILDACRLALEQQSEDCSAERRELEKVAGQLTAFNNQMDVESGGSWRGARKRVIDALSKTDKMIDDVVSLNNWSGLLPVVLGTGGGGGVIPQGELTGLEFNKAALEVEDVVAGRTAWLQENVSGQVDAYREYAMQRDEYLASLGQMEGAPQLRDAFVEARGAALAVDAVKVAELGAGWDARQEALQQQAAAKKAAAAAARDEQSSDSQDEAAVSDAEGVDTQLEKVKVAEPELVLLNGLPLARQLRDGRELGITYLEGGINDAVMNTASISFGAVAFAIVMTWVLQTTAEDLTALAFGIGIAYLSVIALPLRRSEIKERVNGACVSVLDKLEEQLDVQYGEAMEECTSVISGYVQPLLDTVDGYQQQIEEAEGKRQGLEQKLGDVKDLVAGG